MLISLALVCEDGRELYLVNSDADLTECNDWVKKNVIPQLPPKDARREVTWNGEMRGQQHTTGCAVWVPHSSIETAVRMFVGGDPAPEIWAYYADYDWVLFCQLFGAMVNLPQNFPMMCLDLQQYAIHLEIRKPLKQIVPMPKGEHDALCDAHWNSRVHRYLMEEQVARWVRRG